MATPAAQPSQSSEDWQTTKETVRDRTAFLFNNSLLSDIKFVVTDSQDQFDNDSKQESNNDSRDEPDNESRDVSESRKVRIPAHKFVLAISSPVFQAMFYGQMAEKGEEVELPDTDSHSLLEFLRFVYCDEVNLTADNVFAVLYLADKYIVPSLAAKCWSFIDANTTACVKSDRAVSTLSHVTLVSLLKRDSLSTKECPLFDAVKHWAEAKCEQNSLEPTGEAMRAFLGEAVNFIRFPTMSQQDFAEQVVPTGILTADDALEVHQYFFQVIQTSNIKFSCTYRAGKVSERLHLHRCRLYENMKVTENRVWGKLNEDLRFVVEPRDVHLKGVRLFASKETTEAKCSAVIRLLNDNGDLLATKEGTFQSAMECSGGTDKYAGFDVMFEVPVLIRKTSKYKLEVEVQRFCFLVIEQICTDRLVVYKDGIYFNFEGTSCLIRELLFHTLN